MQDEVKALEKLKTILEWILGLQERVPGALQFGLIHVCFHNTEILGQAYGAPDAAKMLKELARKLRLSFRKTDLVARDCADFWVLVPYTSPATVTEKIALLVKIASEDGLNIVDRDVAVFSMPDPVLTQGMAFQDVSQLLEHLKKNRQIALRWQPAAIVA
jgi:hypothetical protein